MSRKDILSKLTEVATKNPNHWFDLHRPDGTFIRGAGTPIGMLRIARKIINPTENIIKVYANERLHSEVSLETLNED